MSIRDQITAHVDAGVLVPYRAVTKKSPRRRLFFTRPAFSDLTGEGSAVRLLGFRGQLEAALTRWVNGEHVYRGFLKRLSKPPPEIWEIRVTEPLVRARVFVRFAEPDTLIATSIRTRQLLGKRGSREWTRSMQHCVDSWDQLFPEYAPFTAATTAEYVTEKCDDLDL